jgi:hypothetical protein
MSDNNCDKLSVEYVKYLENKIKYLEAVVHSAIALWCAIPDPICDGLIVSDKELLSLDLEEIPARVDVFVNALDDYEYACGGKN